MIDLKGIEYPLFAGVGSICGLAIISPILCVLAFFWPVLWAWVFAPAAAGAVAGLIFAGVIEK